MSAPPPVCAWREEVDLPELGVRRLRAKLDTGARTSALHVEEVALVDAAGRPSADEDATGARFRVVTDEGPVAAVAPLVGFVVIRTSGGRDERRPLVRTRVVCGPVDVATDVALTDRSGMVFRMLLGRRALAGRCVVDPSGGYRHRRVDPCVG